MAVVSQRRPAAAGTRFGRPVGKPALVAGVVAAMLLGFVVFRNDFAWPSGLGFSLSERMDRVYDWVVDNQNSSPIFVYFFNYISNFLDWLATSLTDLLQGMTWIGVTFAGVAVSLRWCGWRVALLVLASFAAFGLMGVWTESIQTLALMIAAVIVSLSIGIPLGVLAGRSDRFQSTITPVLDAMQIIPAFAYLMPVVILFSVGNPAAVIATVVYAVPPAVRITALGIRSVSAEAVESAQSLGATGRQVLTKVQLPLARRAIMLGVNQTIMMALSMVVIASLIGGRGLGDVVISALTYLDVGEATVAGVAIVILAIALDRTTAAAGARLDTRREPSRLERHGHARLLAPGILVLTVIVTLIARAAGAGAFPGEVTVGDYVYRTSFRDDLTGWINSAIEWVQDPAEPVFPITSSVGDFVVSYALEPLRTFLTETPWWLVIAGFAGIALVVAGRRAALIVAVMMLAIGVMGVWTPAMDTASQVLVATLLTLLIGFALGVWAAESRSVERLMRPVLDGLQTLPQFVYLIPVVALFNVGRVPGVIASVLYAIPVVIRLVTAGLRDVSPTAIEAAAAFGATRAQLLRKVKIPLARRSIMLGINQGIIMVLAVVIVAGLVGGGALGYGVVVGLQRNQFGDGVVASLAILALGIVLDRITQTGARVHAEQQP